jgi:hypothetical protein
MGDITVTAVMQQFLVLGIAAQKSYCDIHVLQF